MPTTPVNKPKSLTPERARTILGRTPFCRDYPLHKRESAWVRARIADGVAGTFGEVLRKIGYPKPYSWKPEHKASRECLRWAIQKALADKAFARGVTAEWRANACGVSVDGVDRDLRESVLKLARRHVNYLRLRAFMRGAYSGYPDDRPATDQWNELNPQARREY